MRAVSPSNGDIIPIGNVGIALNELVLEILNTPVSPVTLLTRNSSVVNDVETSVLLATKAFEIDVVNVLVLASCPSNVNDGAVTSPFILNVVALASLSVDPERPDTVPVTLPVKLPIKFCA